MPKLDSKGKKDRTMEQYCSVCKKTFEMPVIDGEEGGDVVWLKCPGCKGFLPYMTEPDGDVTGAEGEDQGGLEDLALEDIDVDKAKEYSEKDEYEIGDIIYHRSWNDYGKVIVKETLPGRRKTIIVHFVDQGKIRLLEGVA